MSDDDPETITAKLGRLIFEVNGVDPESIEDVRAVDTLDGHTAVYMRLKPDPLTVTINLSPVPLPRRP